jgi:Domain of unknown function (DUF6285)
MMDQPSIRELVDAVREFLEKRAMPELKGHTAFHARVASNALGIVSRELEHGEAMARDELARLTSLLKHGGPLETLNRELCGAIRDGTFGLDDAALRAHLEQTVRDKVAIDQPNYAGAKR